MAKRYKLDVSQFPKSQKKWADKQFKEYLNDNELDSTSDLQLLEELVYREALQNETKAKIFKLQENQTVKEKNLIPRDLTSFLDENLKYILELKDKLGLFTEKTNQDAFKYMESLQKKFKKYLLENQASRTYCCPHCSQMILAIQTMEGWEAKRHPYFSDKYLLNPAVWKLYEQGKITKEESAQILGVSPDYIDFIQKKRKPTS